MTTTPIVPDYSTRLTAALATHSVEVEPWPTGGGCYALATGDGRFLITNGDSALPDGETDEHWETLALACDYGPDGDSGEEIATLEVCAISHTVLQSVSGEGRESFALDVDTAPTVADQLARWILARR